MAQREKYLKDHWKPYPSISRRLSSLTEVLRDTPEHFVLGGRVIGVDSGFLEIMAENQTLKMRLVDSCLLAPGFTSAEVLKVGDLVSVEARFSKTDFMPQIENIELLVFSKSEFVAQSAFTVSTAQKWQRFIENIREFFKARQFIELRTPSLVTSPGLEPYLDPFATEFVWGRERQKLYLPTSPEFHLKKALALGFERCFEMKECFRNSELGDHHQPEFLMLEWYRSFDNLESVIRDVCELLTALRRENAETEIDGFDVQILKMEDLWFKVFNFTLKPDTTATELRELARTFQIDTLSEEPFDDLFARLFLTKVEPWLAEQENPVIIWHYPPSQSALARLTHDGWADRFEVYWRGLEIANAFHELNDPQEQRRRFLEDQEKKRRLGKEVVPIDQEFLAALDFGLPPSAGIAMGLERLFMALNDIKQIRDVRLFSK